MRELHDKSYQPRPYVTFEILEPKRRTISAAAFRDRVVHHGLCAELEPMLERNSVDESYACRVGKGTKRAIRYLGQQVRRNRYALKLDVRHYFETLSHDVLKRLLCRRIDDEGIRWLLDLFIDAGAPGSPQGRGIPIGNLTSQHFANFYLGPLDRHIKRGLRVRGYCRYMDDMILLGETKAQLWAWHRSVHRFAEERLKLELKDEVTRIMPVTEGVPFLGFVVFPGTVRFDPVRLRRFRRKLRALDRKVDRGSVDDENAECSASSLIGWASHGDTVCLQKSMTARYR